MEFSIVFAGRNYTLRPRAAAMVQFILEQTAEIEAIPFGSLTFHLAGRKIQPELTRSYRSLAADPDRKDHKKKE